MHQVLLLLEAQIEQPSMIPHQKWRWLAMSDDWLLDGGKIPDEVMNYFRKRAVQTVQERGLSVEVMSEVFGFSRSCIYTWLTRYDRDSYKALESGQAPGAEVVVITAEMNVWLERRW